VGATGNVATEDVAYLLRGMDIDTGIDFDALVDVGQFISERLNRVNGSRAARGWLAQRARHQSQA
jgi:hydroxymethylglutaryl-CoA lyase